MASGLLLSSVSNEKKDRVIETLLLSVHPRQLLIGKTVAQGIAGLLQAAVWGGMAIGLFALTGNALRLPPGIELSPSLLAWGILFFLLGYALYASLLAGAGALVPDIKASPMVSLMKMSPDVATARSPAASTSSRSETMVRIGCSSAPMPVPATSST